MLGWLARRGVAEPVPRSRRCGCWPKRPWPAFPLGGFSWGEVGYAFHNIGVGRALASDGGVALVTFFAVALQRAPRRRAWSHARHRRRTVARSRGCASARALAVVVVVPAVAVVAAHRAASRPARCASRSCRATTRTVTSPPPKRRAATSRTATSRSRRRCRGPVDLVVFPESSMDADPAHRPVPAATTSARSPAARTRGCSPTRSVDAPASGQHAGRRQGAEPQRAVRARRHGRGHLREAAPRAVRRVRPVPRPRSRAGSACSNQIPRDFEPGTAPGLFEIAGHKVATIICFESAFGYQVRPLVHAGAQVIVVSTNNRSYERSANSAQHVAIGQMRAAETGRPVVQAAISGISAIIDADGVVHQRTAAVRAHRARGDGHRDHGRDALRPLRRVGDLGCARSASLGAVAVRARRGRRSRVHRLARRAPPSRAPSADRSRGRYET